MLSELVVESYDVQTILLHSFIDLVFEGLNRNALPSSQCLVGMEGQNFADTTQVLTYFSCKHCILKLNAGTLFNALN